MGLAFLRKTGTLLWLPAPEMTSPSQKALVKFVVFVSLSSSSCNALSEEELRICVQIQRISTELIWRNTSQVLY